MNKENASKLCKIIQEAGDYLEGQLLKINFLKSYLPLNLQYRENKIRPTRTIPTNILRY